MAGHTDEATPRTSRDEGWSGAIRQFAMSSLDNQKHRAREGLDGMARAIRQSADPFEHEGRTDAARYVRTAADQMERFATRLDQRNLGDIVHDLEAFARRQPAIFIGAALGLGLLGARFFKSSSDSLRNGERTDAAGASFTRSPYYDADLPGGANL